MNLELCNLNEENVVEVTAGLPEARLQKAMQLLSLFLLPSPLCLSLSLSLLALEIQPPYWWKPRPHGKTVLNVPTYISS